MTLLVINGRFSSFISTHTPREGSDLFLLIVNGLIFLFQPTLPARGVTIYRCVCFDDGSYISTHTPREGSDTDHLEQIVKRGKISTHTPREGSDWSF